MAKENPAAYEGDLANTCSSYGVFCEENGKPQEAEALYREALAIRRRLAEENPAAYEPNLANTCSNYGSFCADSGKPKDAEELYLDALEIYRRLAEENPVYRSNLASNEMLLALLCKDSDHEEYLTLLRRAHDHFAERAEVSAFCAEQEKCTAQWLAKETNAGRSFFRRLFGKLKK